jgi:hypothetical protein
MAEHRTSNLKISGERVPEVEKLQNGRYRLEFRCTGFSREDWFSENAEGSIFASLGSLMNSEMEIDGLGGSESLEGEAYDNMRLIENRLEYTPSGNLVVYFRYETLGDTFANEVDDVVDYTTSGLRRVTRVLIAKADTSYSKEVGIDSISHSVGAGGTLTLPLAGYRIEDNNAYRRVTETWVEKGILAVSTPLVGGQQTIEVQAIGLTEAEVGTLLSEVTASHVLISQSTSDYDGLNTIRYTFEVDDFDVVEYTETNLKMVTRTELSETSFAEVTIGTDTYLTAPTLYAGTQTIDNGNTIKKRVTKWLEAGKLFERENNPDDGIKRVTTGWWHAVGTTVGPIISRDTQNYLGFNVITIETMTAPDGTDITDGDNDKKVADFETLANWTRPGVVALSEKLKNGTSAATKVNVWQQPPCEMKVRAHVEIYFSKSEAISNSVFDSITGGTAIKLWNPEDWATLDGSGANDHNVDEINRTYRGFRVVDSTDAIYSATYPKYGTYAEAIQGRDLLIYYNAGWFGKWFETGAVEGTVIGEASLSGGPEKPEGKIWMLDVQNPKAFTDVDGVDYYKKTYVWTYIPDFEAGENIWDDAP